MILGDIINAIAGDDDEIVCTTKGDYSYITSPDDKFQLKIHRDWWGIQMDSKLQQVIERDTIKEVKEET